MISDVVITGGGPTGLMLASELRLAGVSPIVLERLPDPSGLSKALGIQGRGVDLLDHRGLLDRFAEGALGFGSGFAHFALIPLDLRRLKGPKPKYLFTPQARTEQILEDRARELGAEIRRGHEVTGLDQDADGVTLSVHTPSGDYTLRARFVVGCDGGHSAVRRLAGIGFPGMDPTSLLRIGDVHLPEEFVKQPRIGPFPIVPLGDGVYRVTAREPYPPGFDRSAPMTLDELKESVRRVWGVDLPMSDPKWLSRFTDASRQADRYRAGRVFVAGDAAHVHLPAGGPGLTTGLLDAANLGWKLAAEVQGWAPEGLLDTYHTERHPVGKRVLMHTRAQGMLGGKSEAVAAFRELMGELLQDESTLRRIVDLLQGADIRYDVGGDPHPLLGMWAPDLHILTASGSKRISELMHRARGVLIDLTDRDALATSAQGWADRVDVVRARVEDSPPPADALLVRPDGYVAWVAATGEADDRARQSLERALTKWFGSPAARKGA